MASDRPANQSRLTRFAIVGAYLRINILRIVGGCLAVLCSIGLALVAPYIIKSIFELLEQGEPLERLVPRVLLLLAISAISGAMAFVSRKTFLALGRDVEFSLRRDLMAHLTRLPILFYRQTRTGEIMARLNSDVEAVRRMIGNGMLHAAETILTFLIALPMMIYLSPKLTLYSLAPAIVLPILTNRLGNAIHARYIPIQRKYAEMTTAVQENLAGTRIVRAYRQEGAQVDGFTKLSNEYISLNLRLARLLGIFFPLTMFTASLLMLSTFYFGGLEVIRGDIPLGTLVAFFVYLGLLFWPLFAMGGLISMYERGTVSLDRLKELFAEQQEAAPGEMTSMPRSIKGHIEFKDLCFGYNAQHAVLENISFTAEPGQVVGITGPTGSGKTTMVSLLPKLFPCESGQIFVDGIDINSWDSDTLRRNIAYATQEAFLFSDTIASNIDLGRPDGTEADIKHAATIAALIDDAGNSDIKLDEIVGERGVMLSGGQKQRTSLARAINRSAPILILDDVTSAVDSETEARILDAIRKNITAGTTFIISQRVSTLNNADVILYLEKGRIIESGTFDDLIKRDGPFAAMYRMQKLSEELDVS
ncbi:MAG: ABC transporter ATP-binding protein [Candidatus Zixiibacteriota bacterium]